MTSTSTLTSAPSKYPNAGASLGPHVHASIERRLPGFVTVHTQADNFIKVHAGPLDCACNTRLHYRAGDVDIMPAGMLEEWEEFTPSTTLVVKLPNAILRDAAEQAGVGARMSGLEARFQIRDPQIEHLAWALNVERADAYPGGRIYTDLLGMALAIHLLGRYGAPPLPYGGLGKRQLRKVTDYIEDNLDQDMALARLAALLDMSVSHFSALFKRAEGIPVHEYVIRRRVERARTLLQVSNLPVSQIALDVGFAHQSHLARWMRRLLGVTPTDLRRRSTS